MRIFRTGRTNSVCFFLSFRPEKPRLPNNSRRSRHGRSRKALSHDHTPWKDGFWNESELSELCQRLHKLGPSKIVITGLPCLIHGKEGFENYLSCKEPFSQRACLTPSAGPSRHGTGDIFASILMADALNGVDFSVSVQKAADFISKCISASKALQIPEPDGVCFENFLSDLADQ